MYSNRIRQTPPQNKICETSTHCARKTRNTSLDRLRRVLAVNVSIACAGQVRSLLVGEVDELGGEHRALRHSHVGSHAKRLDLVLLQRQASTRISIVYRRGGGINIFTTDAADERVCAAANICAQK